MAKTHGFAVTGLNWSVVPRARKVNARATKQQVNWISRESTRFLPKPRASPHGATTWR